jgi:hypothetical protein
MTDRLCASLRSAREKLCVAQTDVEHASHRQWLQEALDHVDRIGVFCCPDWSRYNQPPLPEKTDPPVEPGAGGMS